MSQSLSKNYLHVVFATKYREDAFIKEDLPTIHAYIAGVLDKMECPVMAVGGTTNHVHVLFVLNKNIALAKAMEDMKRAVTQWLRKKAPFYSAFAWQNGYGAFSVSQSLVKATVGYINNQEEHHRRMSFQEEYEKFLTAYEVEYNKDYL